MDISELGDSLDKLRQLEDSESRKLLRDSLLKQVEKQLEYADALRNYKTVVADTLHAVADDEEIDISDEDFLNLGMLGSEFASLEHRMHQSAKLCDAITSDQKTNLTIASMHSVFMLGSSPAMECVEAYVAFNRQLSKSLNGSIHMHTVNTSRSDINKIGDDYLRITEEYVETLRFIIDDKRTVN